MSYDAVIVGAGPNGLAAAIALGRAGLATLVVEAADDPGGGARTRELTLPGVLHDVCSAVHPLGMASPWFRAIGLDVEWVQPDAPLAHVLADGRAVMLERSLDDTARGLGADGPAYRRLLEPFVERFDELQRMLLAPVRWPRSPGLLARFGLEAVRSVHGLAGAHFDGDEAPALLAGLAAHGMVPPDRATTAALALVLGVSGHAVGWPIARGGSGAITAALVARLREAGGVLELGRTVGSLDELPAARAYLFDTTPRQLLAIAGDRVPPRARDRLAAYRHGPAAFKVDWALRGPVPWRDPQCARAGTVHLAGSLADVTAAEQAIAGGQVPDAPFVLFAQPSRFDASRAPRGIHVGWGYCHVPNGSAVDATARIERMIERHAPGFTELIAARAVHGPAALERYNANYLGGDILTGAGDARALAARMAAGYSAGAPDLWLCSAATPPGAGVHGMCGYWAAAAVLRAVFDLPPPPLATLDA